MPLNHSALQEARGTSDERDGGPGRVQRCKTHLDTALAGVKTVDFFPLCLYSILFCCLWGQKACKYWRRTIETTGESVFKMSGHCLEKVKQLESVFAT